MGAAGRGCRWRRGASGRSGVRARRPPCAVGPPRARAPPPTTSTAVLPWAGGGRGTRCPSPRWCTSRCGCVRVMRCGWGRAAGLLGCWAAGGAERGALRRYAGLAVLSGTLRLPLRPAPSRVPSCRRLTSGGRRQGLLWPCPRQERDAQVGGGRGQGAGPWCCWAREGRTLRRHVPPLTLPPSAVLSPPRLPGTPTPSPVPASPPTPPAA